MRGGDSINIRPGVAVLAVLRHLNYQPWFAFAEFVDNALQSFLQHREELIRADGPDAKLRVSIDLDTAEGRITVRDNAAGIGETEYERAFRPAEIPPDCSGLSEFGMGMKSAACYFSPHWSVRTSALGEPVEKTVTFDISTIVRDELEDLRVETREADPRHHYTEIVLSNIHKPIQGRSVWKIKEHLADIYRVFERQGVLELRLNGDLLSYRMPAILNVPHFREPDGPAVEWRSDIDFDFGEGLRASGFAALRETGSTTRAGFALFRRGRLIQGSGDQGYRPEFIFGRSNSFVYQRLFGELHLEGFEVSHTKDGFRWDENEEVFLEFLKDKLEEESLPLLQQARYYRARPRREDLRQGAQQATKRTGDVIETEGASALEELWSQPLSQTLPPDLPEAQSTSRRVIDLELRGEPWQIVIELTDDPAVGDWLEVSDRPDAASTAADVPTRRRIGLRMSLVHPFMQRFGGTGAAEIEPLLRVAAAIGLAETVARDSGLRMAGAVRRNINELLRGTLSQP